ncbi:hypothetical protein SAMN02910418_00109 [Bowdeniella nasicola]|uniref:Arabinofuranosyltransferase AftA N-terminal domain-containing protein n=1 Tax=Bowdeniella nasicola TaxID=208480 RepID=A0A1H3VJQ6_9ACTO|nr:DUF6541 family protein [Bowdeniella nasicola]SDZ75033.1 hypothetical protein SAMN02910418_00109 [Bowdeniella nasicola]
MVLLPGVLIVIAAMPRTRPVFAVAQAPAWTLGVVAVLSFLEPLLPFTWGLIPFIGATLLVAGIAWTIRRAVEGTWHTSWDAWKNARDYRYVGFAAVVWLIVILPIVLTSDATLPVQGGDSNYHYNQLWLMEKTGEASPLLSNATMAGVDPTPWFYPNTWHALLSLVTVGPMDALSVVNAMLVVTPALFLLGTAAFTVVVADTGRAYVWGLVAATFAPLALLRLQLATTLWPFVLAFSVIPGLLAAIVPELQPLQSRRVLRTLAIFALPLFGIFAVHPSVLLVISLPIFVIVVATLLRRGYVGIHRGEKKRSIGAVLLAAALVAAAYLFIILPGPQRYYFGRFPNVDWSGIPRKLFVSTAMFLPGGGAYAVLFYLGVCIITAAGIVLLWKKRKYALLLAWFSQWLIVVASYLPIKGVSNLTALYYNHPNRAEFAAAIYFVPMAGYLFYEIAGWAGERWSWKNAPRVESVLAMVLVLCTTIYGFKGVGNDTETTFHPKEDNVRYLASPEEIAMIRAAGNVLPADAYVIGDPAAGAALLQPLSNIDVVWPYPNYPTKGDDAFLLQRFRLIDSDPFVCDLLNEYDIAYFYDDEARYYNGGYTDALRPGLYGVDTSEGFTEIARGGTAVLYRIDACND